MAEVAKETRVPRKSRKLGRILVLVAVVAILAGC